MKKRLSVKTILTVKVRVGESSYPDARDVVWKTEKECDLILNQFGIFLAGLIRPVPGAEVLKQITLKDTSNTDRNVYVYITGGVGWNTNFNAQLVGTRVGVGSSNQAAARGDYNLISQLGSLVNTDDGAWDSANGRITFSGSVYLSAGGTVREVGFFSLWHDTGAVTRTFMLFRDVISDVVIGAGKYAHVAYTIQC